MDPNDPIRYRKLVQESIELRTKNALEKEPAHQKRENVQKEIWTENEARHIQIFSKTSELTITQKKDKVEFSEYLHHLQGKIEDDFFFSSDKALYTYPSHKLIAQGNCFLKQNENKVYSPQVSLDLSKEMITINDPNGSLIQGPYHFKAKQMIWDKKKDRMYLVQDVHIIQPNDFHLIADRAQVELENLTPKQMILKNNVKLISSKIQNKESYALADRLTYNPENKTLLFSSEKRVLFWQEDLHLSAKEVLVTKDDSIQGIGDVHFIFNTEEQNYIDNLLKNFL